MLSTQTALQAWFLPDDAAEGYPALLALFASAKISLHVFMFGFTDPDCAAAFVAAHKRGVEVWLLLDHLQGAGHVEAALVHQMIVDGFPADHICFTQSTKHAYMHSKECVIDAEADVPDAQYETVGQARAAGYPVTVEGSTNFSKSAWNQTNILIVIPSKPLAVNAKARFEALWAWAEANEQKYQLTA